METHTFVPTEHVGTTTFKQCALCNEPKCAIAMCVCDKTPAQFTLTLTTLKTQKRILYQVKCCFFVIYMYIPLLSSM